MSAQAASAPWNLRDYAVTMARYNQWMNGKIYEAASTLSDEQRKADRGAYFRSIHGTLNHLLLGDRSWMQRLHGEPVTMTSTDEELFSDFAELRAARAEMVERLLYWAHGLEAVEADSEY